MQSATDSALPQQARKGGDCGNAQGQPQESVSEGPPTTAERARRVLCLEERIVKCREIIQASDDEGAKIRRRAIFNVQDRLRTLDSSGDFKPASWKQFYALLDEAIPGGTTFYKGIIDELRVNQPAFAVSETQDLLKAADGALAAFPTFCEDLQPVQDAVATVENIVKAMQQAKQDAKNKVAMEA